MKRKSGSKRKSLEVEELVIKQIPSGLLIERGSGSLLLQDKGGLFKLIIDKDTSTLKALEEILSGEVNDFEEKLKVFRKKKLIFISDTLSYIKKAENLLNFLSIKNIRYFKHTDQRFYKVKGVDAYIVFHKLPQQEFLLRLNKFCLDNKCKLIKVTIEGNKFLFVPFLVPYETPCYNCYCILKSHNFIYDKDTLSKDKFLLLKEKKLSPMVFMFSLLFLFLKLVEFLGEKVYLQEEIAEYVLDLNKLEISKYPLLKVPNCPTCGMFHD